MNPSWRIRLRHAVADDLQHGGVVHQQALGHDGVRALAQLRAFAAMLAQDVAGGDLRDVELLDETLGLSALARTGRAHENDAHARFLTWIFDRFLTRKGAPSKGRHTTQSTTDRQTPAGHLTRHTRETHEQTPRREETEAHERVLCSIGRRLGRHQCLRRGRDRGGDEVEEDRQGVRRPPRHRRRAHRRPHRREQGIAGHDQGTAPHARRRLRLARATSSRAWSRTAPSTSASSKSSRRTTSATSSTTAATTPWTPLTRCPRSAISSATA